MSHKTLEYELAKMDDEGFGYWLDNFFNPDDTAFKGEALKALTDAQRTFRLAVNVIEKVRDENNIEEI